MPPNPSPTYERLRHGIAQRMRPIIQPLMLLEPALGEKPPGPSKIQAADQLFDRAAQLSGHVLEDLPQGADPQGLVGWSGEVLLLAVRASAQPHVTASLTGQNVAMAPQALGQELAVDVPRNPHRASSSCLT